MNPIFNIVLLVLAITAAVVALRTRDLLSAAVILGLYSFLLCLLWANMGAVDVAFTEAAVGAGVSTVLFVATLHRTKRKSQD